MIPIKIHVEKTVLVMWIFPTIQSPISVHFGAGICGPVATSVADVSESVFISLKSSEVYKKAFLLQEFLFLFTQQFN